LSRSKLGKMFFAVGTAGEASLRGINAASEASLGSTFGVLMVVCGAPFAKKSKQSEPKEHVCRTVVRECGEQSEPKKNVYRTVGLLNSASKAACKVNVASEASLTSMFVELLAL
jgi:hypothetical protein